MSGHSKWASIKHQKGAADAKRGKLFTKLGNAVTIAAKLGGGELSTNPRLALAVEMAKKSNMPKENIDRAIKRGTGELGGAQAEEIIYEGYGHDGAALLIETLTDNRNRTIGEIRATLNKYGGKLAEAGSVAYLFRQVGEIVIEASQADQLEAISLAVLETEAEDLAIDELIIIVTTDPKNLMLVKQQLEANQIEIQNAELVYQPKQTLTLTRAESSQNLLKLIDALENLDDITNVVTNAELV